NPAADSYQIGEAARRAQIARQLQANYRVQWPGDWRGNCDFPLKTFRTDSGEVSFYPYQRSPEQPIGHESKQTGPTRWTYRPLYAVEGQDPLAGRPLPRLQSLPLALPRKVEPPAPSDAAPGDFVPPALGPKKPPAGPREF